jgi:cytochrome P450
MTMPADSTIAKKRGDVMPATAAATKETNAKGSATLDSSDTQCGVFSMSVFVLRARIQAGTRAFKPVLGNGLVTSEGAFWLRQRKLIQPAFSKDRVQSYAAAMIGLTNEMLDSWTEGKSVQIDREFEALTSKIALKTLFDRSRRS